MGNNQLIVTRDGAVRISDVLNDCVSLCVPTYKNEPLSSILQKLCTRIDNCCGTSTGGGQTFIEEGDNITITGSGTESDPYIINTGGGGENFFTLDTNSVDLTGDGSQSGPLFATVRRDPAPNNMLIITAQGLLVPNVIEAGIVYGGIVTWLGDYDYHVSAAGYWIDFQFYESPAADFTLSAPDATFNRIDTFVLTVDGTAAVLEGTPSSNPAQAPIDPETQLAVSVALVEVGTTEPSLSAECIYRNNLEWTTTPSNSVRLNPDSTIVPCNSVKSVEGTGVVDNDNILFERGSSFFPTLLHSQLDFYIRPKGTFATNGLSMQWELAGVLVGDPLVINHLSYGFDSLNTGTCQLLAIPLFHFGLTDTSEVDSFRITGEVIAGTLGFYIDDLCIQGQPLPPDTTSVDEKFKIDGDDTTSGFFADKIVAGTGITFTINDVGGNETLTIEAAATNALTFDNGLTRTVDNTQWGGTLLHNTSIDADTFTIDFLGSHDSDGILTVTNFGLDNAIMAIAADGTAVQGNNTGANPTIFGFASGTGTAILGQSLGGVGGEFQASAPGETALLTSGPVGARIRSFDADDNSAVLQSLFSRSLTSGTPLAGFGAYMSFELEADDNLTYESNQIIWEWSDPDNTALSSVMSFTGMNAGAAQTQLSLLETGQLVAPQYGLGNFTGINAYYLATTATGEIIEVAAPGAPGTLTADNGLTINPSDNVQLGGTLIQNTDIEMDEFIFQMLQSGQFFLKLDPTVDAEFSSLLAYNITGASNMAEYRATTTDLEADWQIQSRFDGNTTSAIIEGTSNASTSFIVYQANSHEFTAEFTVADDTVIPTIILNRAPSTFIGDDGLGQSIDFQSSTTTSQRVINQIISTLVDSTDASRSSELSFSVVDSAVTLTALTLLQTGQLQLPEYDTGIAAFTGTPTFLLAVDTNGNVIQTSLGAASGITADNGLTMSTATNAQLGGQLLQDTTIDNDIYELEITGTNAAHLFRVTNSGSGTAGVFVADAASGTGITGSGALGGVFTGITGVTGITTTDGGVAGTFSSTFTSTATNAKVLAVQRYTSGAAGVGMGGNIQFDLENSTGSTVSAGSVGFRWRSPVNGAESSAFELNAINAGVSARKLAIEQTGQLTLDGYDGNNFSGTATGMLAVTSAGLVIEEPVITASNGLTKTLGAIKLGGSLTADTTIANAGFVLNNTANYNSYPWTFVNSHANGGGIYVEHGITNYGISIKTDPGGTSLVADGGDIRITYSNSAGTALNASVNGGGTSTATAGYFYAEDGYALQLYKEVDTTLNAFGTTDMMVLSTAYNVADNDAIAITWELQGLGGFSTSAASIFTFVVDASDGTTALYFANKVDNGGFGDLQTTFSMNDDYSLRGHGYGFGLITGTPAYGVAVDANGKFIEIALGAGSMTNPMSDTGDIIYSADGAGTPAALAIGATGEVLTVSAGGIPEWSAAGVAGSVVSVAVSTANGFAGTVANPTTTANITLTTSQTGVLTGNGTAMTGVTSSTVGQVLRVTGANTFAFGAVDFSDTDAITGRAPLANIVQGTALSVLGVTGNATANYANIAGIANQVLRVNSAGNALLFGQLNLAAAAAVTGTLAASNGGTGNATYVISDLLYATGTSTLSRLAIGTTGQVLTVNAGGAPVWSTPVTGSVNSVSGTLNRITSTGGTTPVIDISAAYIGQSSITTLGTITSGTWSAGTIAATRGGTGQNTVATGDILYGSAANVWSKLAAGTPGQALRVSAGGIPEWAGGSSGTVTSVTGTANRITITGTPTINPTVDISSAYVGQATITTLGTITSGTWNGGAIGATFGGTAQTSWTAGQMLYASGVNTLTKLNPGANGQVLTLAGGLPTWASTGGVGTVTSVGFSTGTTGLIVTSNTTNPITASGTFTLSGLLNTVNGGTGINAYNQGDILYASAPNTLAKLGKQIIASRVLTNQGASNNPTWGQVDLTNAVTGDLPLANLAQGTARSVLGVAGNVTADYAPIQGAASQVLKVNAAGTGLVFEAISLSSAAVTGVLPVVNGGTGLATATSGRILITNGTGYAQVAPTGFNGITVTMGAGTMAVGNTVNPARQTFIDTSGTATFNFDNGAAGNVILTNVGRTFAFAGTPIAGTTYTCEIRQDGSGNRTITTWPATIDWDGASVPTLSTGALKRDLFTFYYDGTRYDGKLTGRYG